MEKQLKLEPLHFVVDPLGVRKNMKTSMILRRCIPRAVQIFEKNDRPLWKQLHYGLAFCYFLYIWLKTPQEKY